MELSIMAEMPIPEHSNILKFETIGKLRNAYPKLKITKYLYIDPKDGKLKGANPPNELPLVADAYITVAGSLEDIKKFSEDLVNTD